MAWRLSVTEPQSRRFSVKPWLPQNRQRTGSQTPRLIPTSRRF